MVESLITMSIVGLLSGFIFSMPIAGPVSILITSHALKGRLQYCNKVAIGASFADFIYVFLAVFGITKLFQYILPAMPYILGVGSVFILFIGYKVFKSKVDIEHVEEIHPKTGRPIPQGKGALYTGFMVNFLNPTLFFGSLTSSFLVISFIASLGFNTGGLDTMIGKNVNALNSIEGKAVDSAHVSNYFKADTLRFLKNQDHSPATERPRWFPLLISLSYALALAFGSIIWFVVMALILARFRHRINKKIINGVIKGLGIVLCLFGIYFAYSAVKMLI